MDQISEMLTAIRNAQAVVKPSVSLPLSNMKYEIARILEQEGFVGKIDKKGKKITSPTSLFKAGLVI